MQPIPSQTFLDWQGRPISLQEEIDSAFKTIYKQWSSGWGYFNGSSTYDLCGVNENLLLKALILDAPSSQKEFTVLDIGAGEFNKIQAFAQFLNQQTDLPQDIHVSLLGVRGEQYWGPRVVTEGRCTLHFLGGFKVEELTRKLLNEEMDLTNRLDLCLSRWTFRHLADPVGTTLQVLNLLRPERGIFALDGFFYLTENDIWEKQSPNHLMTQLLLDSGSPFLTKYGNDTRSLNHFLVRRKDASPIRLPLNYLGTVCSGEGWQIGSGIVTRFQKQNAQGNQEKLTLPKDIVGSISGDKSLFDWMKKKELFLHPQTHWRPLLDRDRILNRSPSLHQFVQLNDLSALKQALEQGANPDEVDTYTGDTPLHRAIWAGFKEGCALLLEKRASLTRINALGEQPLDTAAAFDRKGILLKMLLEKGAPLTSNAVARALDTQNISALRILLAAGAQPASYDQKRLSQEVYSCLHNECLIPIEIPKKRLSDIGLWIERGDCIEIFYPDQPALRYFVPKESARKPHLIQIEVNPETDLLDEEELPSYLREEGILPTEETLDPSKFVKTHTLRFGYDKGKKYTL